MSTNPSMLAESANLDFKTQFELKTDWCELIKDIVAMANSGGGRILIGVSDDGVASNSDVAPLLAVDLADVVNKIRAFTDVNFASLTIRGLDYAGAEVAEITVDAAATPLVFGKAGNYNDAAGKPQCAFRPGTLYVRHGPKSEPATSDDLRSIIDHKIEEMRRGIITNLRHVVEAPPNAIVTIATPAVERVAAPVATVTPDGATTAVRLVESTTVQEAILLDVNTTHPFRQKEVVDAINKQFDGSIRFTTNDNVAIRRLHEIDGKIEFCYRPKFGSRQYSERYVHWLMDRISSDKDFLQNVRQSYHAWVVANNQQRRAARH